MTAAPNLRCPVCAADMREAFRATVLHRHEAIYDHCDACGFLRVRAPHWLDEAYADAIAITDTGLMWRNQLIADQLAALLPVLGVAPGDRCLDYAGGYGVLTRLMRDKGFDFYWSDPYCRNLLAGGFEHNPALGACRLVTAFEVIEHVEQPVDFVQTALAAAEADTLIFSTEVYTGAPPKPADWRYYSLETGQHIGFFRSDTLTRLGKRLAMDVHSSHGLHMLSRRALPRRRIDMALGRLRPLMALLARRRQPTKVMTDHALMVQRLAADAAGGPDARRL
jgi:hypothetical protein